MELSMWLYFFTTNYHVEYEVVITGLTLVSSSKTSKNVKIKKYQNKIKAYKENHPKNGCIE